MVGGRSLKGKGDLVFTVYDDVKGPRLASCRCRVWKVDLGLEATKQRDVGATRFACPHAF